MKRKDDIKMEGLFIILGIIIFIFLVVSVKQIGEYERGLKFTFGKFSKILENFCEGINIRVLMPV